MLSRSNIFEKINLIGEKLNSLNTDDEDLYSEKILSLSREVDEIILEFCRLEDNQDFIARKKPYVPNR